MKLLKEQVLKLLPLKKPNVKLYISRRHCDDNYNISIAGMIEIKFSKIDYLYISIYEIGNEKLNPYKRVSKHKIERFIEKYLHISNAFNESIKETYPDWDEYFIPSPLEFYIDLKKLNLSRVNLLDVVYKTLVKHGILKEEKENKKSRS